MDDRLAFDAPGLAQSLAAASDEALDAVGYGVVEMDLDATVLRYNAVETQYSGLPRERGVGRSFFRDVAPCTNNRRVAQRFDEPALDETIEYTFALRMKPVPVVLRMLKAPGAPVMHLVVRWS
jgi:photoactive yellow protein